MLPPIPQDALLAEASRLTGIEAPYLHNYLRMTLSKWTLPEGCLPGVEVPGCDYRIFNIFDSENEILIEASQGEWKPANRKPPPVPKKIIIRKLIRPTLVYI